MEKEGEKDKKIQAKTKVKPSTIIVSGITLVLIVLLLFGYLIYGRDDYSRATSLVASVIPYPAATVGMKIVKYGDLKDNLSSIKKFYESQDFSEVGLRVDFSTDDGKKRLKIREKDLLNKMIEDLSIETIASANQINVTNEEIHQDVERAIEEYKNGQSVNEMLQRLYGWSLDDFQEKIIRPKLYKDKLEKYFEAQDETKKNNQQKIEIIRQADQQLHNGKSFDDAAKEYSEGMNKESGGDLGWFTEEQMIDPVGKKVAQMQAGSISDIIESELGYHLVKLTEKKKEGENDIYRISQIFLAKKSFPDWLAGQMSSLKIRVFSKTYYWDQANLTVKFRDSQMADFEAQVIEKFKGDPSLMY